MASHSLLLQVVVEMRAFAFQNSVQYSSLSENLLHSYNIESSQQSYIEAFGTALQQERFMGGQGYRALCRIMHTSSILLYITENNKSTMKFLCRAVLSEGKHYVKDLKEQWSRSTFLLRLFLVKVSRWLYIKILAVRLLKVPEPLR